MKSFSYWTIAEVDKEFQVKQQSDCHLLNEWLASADQKFDNTTELPTLVSGKSESLCIEM